jgi:hypothetical protein
MQLPTTSSIEWPHSFRLGAAYSMLEGTLLLAVDVQYSMFAEANRDGCAPGTSNCLAIIQLYPSGPKLTVTPLDWVDSFAVGAGAEYLAHPHVPLRIGYGLVRTQTGDAAASYFFVPPGLAQSVHAGIGWKGARWSFDAGAYYEAAAKTVYEDTIANPGRYAAHAVAMSLTATFHIEREEEVP